MLFVLGYQIYDFATMHTYGQEWTRVYFTQLTQLTFIILTVHMVLLWVICIVHFRRVKTGGEVIFISVA